MQKAAAVLIIISLIFLGKYLSDTRNLQQNQSTNGNTNKGSNPEPYNLVLITPQETLEVNKDNDFRFKLTDYPEENLAPVHFIIIRSDLQEFQHLHPQFDKTTSEFRTPINFATSGKYRLVADFVIPEEGQGEEEGHSEAHTNTAYKDIVVGAIEEYTPQDISVDEINFKTIKDYKLNYYFRDGMTAGTMQTLTINVTKNNKAVENMEEYFGAQAHGIIFKKATLDFAHLHSIGKETHVMAGHEIHPDDFISKGPVIKFEHTFPTAGVYKLFTQFQHEGKVITDERVITIN